VFKQPESPPLRWLRLPQTPFSPVSPVLGGVPMGGFVVSTVFRDEQKKEAALFGTASFFVFT
jgi:hypothetical protein